MTIDRWARALDRVLPGDVAGPIYLSGPMKGIEAANYPAFGAAASLLRARGFVVLSPHEVPKAPAGCVDEYAYYMRADLALLTKAAAIVLLPGWPASRGAGVELAAAESMGCAVYFYDAGDLVCMDRV